MKPDRWKKDLLDDLWCHDDSTARDTALRHMSEAARGRRMRRHAVSAAVAAVAMASSLMMWRSGPDADPPAGKLEVPSLVTVRHFSEAELRERLRGVAVAYVGPPGARKVLLLEDIAH